MNMFGKAEEQVNCLRFECINKQQKHKHVGKREGVGEEREKE
jgi:hypothetical protein